MGEFINITKLPLSDAPYSIASSASTDGLWSLIFIYSGKKIGHLWVIPRAAFIKCLNKWRKLVGPVFGRGCRFVFRVHPIFICLSSSSLLISSLIQRENLLLQEPCSRRLSTLFTRSLKPSLLLETICLVSLLSFSSINFLYFS